MDRRAWWAAVHAVAKSRARLTFTLTKSQERLKDQDQKMSRNGKDQTARITAKQMCHPELTSDTELGRQCPTPATAAPMKWLLLSVVLTPGKTPHFCFSPILYQFKVLGRCS